ncbi:Ctr copper transporter family-domain-containing protein [Syncephalastrum racemosum]|uniref:Copper transport protein n=1 Tax=Syncephalastrum racemosum TaxID=13706 RepID=A0A1X2GZE0_SYNRA|nr:Ctr copper transporter family-domain-containing protein [Syncephalastrum racemosum]
MDMDHDHSSMGHGSSMGDMGSSHDMMDMAPMGTFHWSAEKTDGIWLESWVPATQSAYIGACFGLLFFAILSRGLVALEMYFIAWRAGISQADQHGKSFHAEHDKTDDDAERLTSNSAVAAKNQSQVFLQQLPKAQPFSWILDPSRSFMTALTSFVNYLLMMAVMTGNGGFFIVIVVGIFVGEVCFGRFRSLGGSLREDHC